jgi:hypothetical protein
MRRYYFVVCSSLVSCCSKVVSSSDFLTTSFTWFNLDEMNEENVSLLKLEFDACVVADDDAPYLGSRWSLASHSPPDEQSCALSQNMNDAKLVYTNLHDCIHILSKRALGKTVSLSCAQSRKCELYQFKGGRASSFIHESLESLTPTGGV